VVVAGAINYLLVVALIFHPQGIVEASQHIYPFPKGLNFQSQLMNIYGTASRRNLVYNSSPDPYEPFLCEKR